MSDNAFLVIVIMGVLVLGIPIGIFIYSSIRNAQFQKVNEEALRMLNLTEWKYRDVDARIQMKSSRGVDNYSEIQFFKDERGALQEVDIRLREKKQYETLITDFLRHNELENRHMYPELEQRLTNDLQTLSTFTVEVWYVSPAGRSSNQKIMHINRQFLDRIISDPSIIMGKTEYNKFLKKRNQDALEQKQHDYYAMVNEIIDLANASKDAFVIEKDRTELDRLISSLFDKTVNNIRKIKSLDSEEWDIIEKIILSIKHDVERIVRDNQQIVDYYNSAEFSRIKGTCDSLIESQKDFNEYINEKARSIADLFGSRIIRTETENNDEYNYIRPYQKSITPFTAEVSSAVFANAENNPIDYIIKYFYPNKEQYLEHIRKLQHLVEELETLKDAKTIIESLKKNYTQYLTDVPPYIMEKDEDGFYSRLGFANISEGVLTVEYKFSYTSNGGMAQRSFTVPMTEDTIIELVNRLQRKLTMSAFAKEQRALMTSKLRQFIKERDNFTCRYCGNSTFAEPNLLLEIDHIIPVAKGGCTVEDNLQTLCWRCNRAKSCKINFEP